MPIYAVIDSAGDVVNRIVLDKPGAWQAPEGHSIIEETDHTFEVGGTLINGVYTPPVQPEPPPPWPAVPEV
jgi:hypothetical protein